MPTQKRRKRRMQISVIGEEKDDKTKSTTRNYLTNPRLGSVEGEGPACVPSTSWPNNLESEPEEGNRNTAKRRNTRKKPQLSVEARREKNRKKFESLVNSWFTNFAGIVRCYLERFRARDTAPDNEELCLDCGLRFDPMEEQHSCGLFLSAKCDTDGIFPLKTESSSVVTMKLDEAHHSQCHGFHESDFFAVFDVRARERWCKIELCSEEAVAISLIRHNLWPASPHRPQIAFAIPLMEQLYAFNVSKRTALQRMCEGLQIFAKVTSLKQEKSLYESVRSNLSFRIFCKFYEMVHYLRGLEIAELEDAMKLRCAACATKNGKVCICADGNFQMVQKFKSGQSANMQLTSDFLCDQEEVDVMADEYVNVREKRTKDNALSCANFDAGDAVVQANRNKGLEVKGVFGTCCRHMFPLLFLDMKYGERYCYPSYIMGKLAERYDPSVELHLQYDIACKLKAHFEKNKADDLLDRYKFWIPEFHKYAHGTKCQLEFSAWVNGGVGLSDGEAMERFWSLFQQAIKCMKEMSGLNRKAYFDSALYFIGKDANDTQGCKATDYESEERINALVDTWLTAIQADLEQSQIRANPKQYDSRALCGG